MEAFRVQVDWHPVDLHELLLRWGHSLLVLLLNVDLGHLGRLGLGHLCILECLLLLGLLCLLGSSTLLLISHDRNVGPNRSIVVSFEGS